MLFQYKRPSSIYLLFSFINFFVLIPLFTSAFIFLCISNLFFASACRLVSVLPLYLFLMFLYVTITFHSILVPSAFQPVFISLLIPPLLSDLVISVPSRQTRFSGTQWEKLLRMKMVPCYKLI